MDYPCGQIFDSLGGHAESLQAGTKVLIQDCQHDEAKEEATATEAWLEKTAGTMCRHQMLKREWGLGDVAVTVKRETMASRRGADLG